MTDQPSAPPGAPEPVADPNVLDDRQVFPYGEATPITGVPCKQCGGPVPAPKRRGVVKEFCRDRCRAAHRDAMVQLAIRMALDAIDQIDAWKVQLDAARAMLDRFKATGRKRGDKGIQKT
jgi:hypothetical protein